MNNTLIRISLATLLLSFTGTGFAQSGKALRPIVAATTEKNVGRFILHPALLPKISPAGMKNIQAASVTPKPAISREKFENLGSAMTLNPSKQMLNYAQKLSKERTEAFKLTEQLKRLQTLKVNSKKQDSLLKTIDGFVINRSLQNYLLTSLVNGNYIQFMRDLTNYYSLTLEFLPSYELRFIAEQDMREIFAQTALAYLKAHPHKMNLKLREIMKNPEVNPDLKTAIHHFLAMSKLLPEQENRFLTLMREAYKIHASSLTRARSDADVLATVDYYSTAQAELEAFIKKNKRQPRWNAPAAERSLYNKLELIIRHNQANYFKQVEPIILRIQGLLNNYPVAYPSYEDTLTALRVFAKKYSRLPRPIIEASGKMAANEPELYSAMLYWLMNEKKMPEALNTLQKTLPKRNQQSTGVSFEPVSADMPQEHDYTDNPDDIVYQLNY